MPDPGTPAAHTALIERWRVPIALILIVAAGVWVRIDDINSWRVDAARFFVDGAPLLINPDGYHYLGLARDLVEDDYAAVDPLRSAPEGAARPMPPPPLSLLTAALANSRSSKPCSPIWASTSLKGTTRASSTWRRTTWWLEMR